jgi:eukaryotic-like serine/threonine-protein kinase
VVLTHPARWGEALLGKLREAANNAGTGDPVLVPEPVAAAWHYARPVDDGTVVALEARNGEVNWEQDIGVEIRSSPTVATEGDIGVTVYVGSDNGSMYALFAADGEEVWTYAAEDEVNSTPVIADSVVYFTDDDGYLHAVDAPVGG